MRPVVIGVDGGSTKTIALVADLQGQVLGMARGAGSNAVGEDIDQAMRVVCETTQAALAQAGAAAQEAVLGVFSLAGADWPEDIERRRIYLEKTGLARSVIVKNDVFGGLRAGTRSPFGVVIAAGTGANTGIITPSGQEWAFGYYQNFGGALDFSREAIEAVLRAEDGRGEPTLLTELVLTQLGFNHPEEMLKALVAHKIDQGKKLALCPRVFEASCSGDRVAAEIIIQHGLTLAEYAVAAIRRFKMEADSFDVVLAGSVFKGPGELFSETIRAAIQNTAPLARVVRSHFEPAVGAVLLAYDTLNHPVSEHMYTLLAETGPKAEFFNTDG